MARRSDLLSALAIAAGLGLGVYLLVKGFRERAADVRRAEASYQTGGEFY